MKYLLVIALVLVIFWLWRHNRTEETKAAQPQRPRTPAEKEIVEMVACEVCHVHLPRSEALIGRAGFYCSEAHRRAAGGAR